MKLVRAVLIAATGIFFVTGCETTHVNKIHHQWETVADETTVGQSDQSQAAPATGQPPVPGSPTAAGEDGLQPQNDDEARVGPGAEEGRASATSVQPKDPFQRQLQ
jgi:hypothetical protein